MDRGCKYMKNNLVLTVILVIIAAGAGFYGGMKYQQMQRRSFANGQFNGGQFALRQGLGTRNGASGQNRGGFRPVAGQIVSSDDKSITVKLQDGSSKIILLSDRTQIIKADKVGKSELKSGLEVAVFGTENTDGSVTAQNIQLNPVIRQQP